MQHPFQGGGRGSGRADRAKATAPLEENAAFLRTDDTLETALRKFDDSGGEELPVVEPTNTS